MTAHKNVLPGFIAGIVLTLALTGAITYAANRAENSGPAAPVSVLYDIPGQGAQPAAGTDIDGGAHGGFTPNVNVTPATGSPGSSTTYPMPVYTPATTASNGNQALAAGLIALGDAGYNAATQVPIPDAGLNGYQTITVQNMGTSAVWCGPASTVNSVSGQQLDPSPDGVHAGGLYSSPLPTYCWSAAAMTSPNDLRWSEVK